MLQRLYKRLFDKTLTYSCLLCTLLQYPPRNMVLTLLTQGLRGVYLVYQYQGTPMQIVFLPQGYWQLDWLFVPNYSKETQFRLLRMK